MNKLRIWTIYGVLAGYLIWYMRTHPYTEDDLRAALNKGIRGGEILAYLNMAVDNVNAKMEAAKSGAEA